LVKKQINNKLKIKTIKMKKQILTFFLVLATSAIFAEAPLSKGQSQINFGVGFSPNSIPVYLGFDHAIHKDITLGAELSWRGYDERYDKHDYHHSVIGISGNANYHFNTVLNIPSNWDFYAGVNVGFYSWNSPNDYYGNHNSGLGLGGQIGGRYYFNNKVGINLEFGGGNEFSQGKIGLTIKI
jgi:hypothetical protein